MNIGLNHFKTRAVFDVTEKRYEDISFILNTEQVHTHDHVYLFVTPQLANNVQLLLLDLIPVCTEQEANGNTLEDGLYYCKENNSFFWFLTVEENSLEDKYRFLICNGGVVRNLWNTNQWTLPTIFNTISVSHESDNVKISLPLLTGNSTGQVDSATTTSAGVMSATDKTKLDGIEAGSQVNVIESIKLGTQVVNPDANKCVTIPFVSGNSNGIATYQMYNSILGVADTSNQQTSGSLKLVNTLQNALLNDQGNVRQPSEYITCLIANGNGLLTINSNGAYLYVDGKIKSGKYDLGTWTWTDIVSAEIIEENELVISSALNDLNERINALTESETVTAYALNDLNNRSILQMSLLEFMQEVSPGNNPGIYSIRSLTEEELESFKNGNSLPVTSGTRGNPRLDLDDIFEPGHNTEEVTNLSIQSTLSEELEWPLSNPGLLIFNGQKGYFDVKNRQYELIYIETHLNWDIVRVNITPIIILNISSEDENEIYINKGILSDSITQSSFSSKGYFADMLNLYAELISCNIIKDYNGTRITWQTIDGQYINYYQILIANTSEFDIGYSRIEVDTSGQDPVHTEGESYEYSDTVTEDIMGILFEIYGQETKFSRFVPKDSK